MLHIQAARRYEKGYYLHNEAFWVKQDYFPRWSKRRLALLIWLQHGVEVIGLIHRPKISCFELRTNKKREGTSADLINFTECGGEVVGFESY